MIRETDDDSLRRRGRNDDIRDFATRLANRGERVVSREFRVTPVDYPERAKPSAHLTQVGRPKRVEGVRFDVSFDLADVRHRLLESGRCRPFDRKAAFNRPQRTA